MVEIEKIQLKSYMFMGIILHFPCFPLYFIVSKNCMVVFECIDLTKLPTYDECSIVVIPAIQDLSMILDTTIMQCNAYAEGIGITLGMKVKDVLLYCEEYE